MRSNIESSLSDSPLHLFDDSIGRDAAAQPATAGDEVLSIEDLANRFNVSTKTISRWRDHGLVAERHLVGGRRRVGFLASAVERFIRDNPLRIERGSRFSQLSQEEHDRIIGWARRLALAGACPADVHRRIASRLNRLAKVSSDADLTELKVLAEGTDLATLASKLILSVDIDLAFRPQGTDRDRRTRSVGTHHGRSGRYARRDR